MALTTIWSIADRPSSPSHNIKPGRRRWSIRPSALLFCMVFLLISAQAHAAALHRGNIDQILKAIVARQDPLSSSAPTSTAAPSHTSSTVIERPKTTTTSSKQPAPSNGTATVSAEPQLTALPKAFDSIIGNNFTNEACPKFLEGLSANPSFNNCLPLSIIMQSDSFFNDASSLILLDDVLDATCNVNLNSCQALMESYAEQLKSNENCGGDYALSNPVVIDAYNGFLSYTPLYQAGCLKTSVSASSASFDSSSNGPSQYCYATATSSETNAINAYIYSLPLGSPLPSSGSVNCTTCLQQTMGFFANAATNATSPMATLYNGAAKEINSQCGASWVKPSITVDQSTQQNAATEKQSQLGMAMLIAVTVSWVMS